MSSLLYERIKLLCEENNTTVAKLERDLGLSNSTIRKWRSNISPSVDKVIKVAKHFNVSIDYLVGFTDIREPVNNIICDDDIISFQRAKQRMSANDSERMMKTLRAAFDYAFNDSSKEQDNND